MVVCVCVVKYGVMTKVCGDGMGVKIERETLSGWCQVCGIGCELTGG